MLCPVFTIFYSSFPYLIFITSFIYFLERKKKDERVSSMLSYPADSVGVLAHEYVLDTNLVSRKAITT